MIDLNNDAYVWACQNGHESAVTELQMRSIYIRPVCSFCNAPLTEKLRPYNPNRDLQFGLEKETRGESLLWTLLWFLPIVTFIVVTIYMAYFWK